MNNQRKKSLLYIPFLWIRFVISGILAIILFIFNFIKYILYAIISPFLLIAKMFHKSNKQIDKDAVNISVNENEDFVVEENDLEKNSQSTLKTNNSEEEYISDPILFKNNMDLKEKKTVGDHISDGLEAIFSPIALGVRKFKAANQKSLEKQQEKARKKFKTEPLSMDFDGEEATKLDKKVVWQYRAINRDGKVVTGYFEALSKVDVYSYLISEGMTVYEIKTNGYIQFAHAGYSKNVKMKNKDLIFFLTQLSTYVKSGIPLVEAMGILTRQFKKKSYQRMFRSIMYDLTMGDSFSLALEKKGKAFPGILITMVKSAELTGELPETLDDMAEYFTQVEASRKEMISALTYPTIVFVFAIAVVTFVMMYVVPKFVEIYSTMDSSDIPRFTKIVIGTSNYLQDNILWIILFIILLLIIIRYLYKNVKVTRMGMQWILMHIPIIREIMIYKEVNMFTKTFHSLLSHNVYITDSMQILNHVTENEIYKLMIRETLINLSHGDQISKAFKDHWAFPLPAYEMIVTGEKTGQLAEMMGKVSEYYQELHRNTVTRVKALIEPIIIVFLTVAVGIIVLAIIIPMFNLYSTVQSLS